MLALDKVIPFCGDSAYGGAGYIAGESPGLVTVVGAPSSREIRVVHRATGILVARKFSVSDGTYLFPAFNPSEDFDLIGRDWTGTYSDVIVGGVTPYTGPDLSALVVPAIQPGDAVSWQLAARYGELPLTWSITGLPAWLSVTTGGLVTGTAPGTESTTPITITCTDAHGEATTVAVAVAVALPAWWRLLISANNGGAYTSVAEIEFRAFVGGASLCVGGAPFASSVYPGWGADKAFDGISADPGWSTDTGVSVPASLGYQLSIPAEINQVMIRARAAGGSVNQSPKDFKIQSSADGATWSDEWTVTGATGWSAGEIRTFNRP